MITTNAKQHNQRENVAACDAVTDALMDHLVQDAWLEVESIRCLRSARESQFVIKKTVTTQRGGAHDSADASDFVDAYDPAADRELLPSDVPDLYDVEGDKDGQREFIFEEDETCDWTDANAEYASQLLRRVLREGLGTSFMPPIPIEIYLRFEEELQVAEHIQIAHKLIFDGINHVLLRNFGTVVSKEVTDSASVSSREAPLTETIVSPRSRDSLAEHRQPETMDGGNPATRALSVIPAWGSKPRDTKHNLVEMATHRFDDLLEMIIADVLKYDRADRGPGLPENDSDEVPRCG